MKKLIFILILGSLFAHPEDSSSLDLLILRTSASYNGEYISIDEKYIYFKPTGNLVEQPVEKNKIEKVTLSDGTVIFDYVKSIDIYVPLDVDSPNLISSLFGDCSLSGDIGVGLHIQSIPKVSMPIRFKKMIIEPSLEFSSVTIIKKPLQATIFSIGMYRLFPINNINIFEEHLFRIIKKENNELFDFFFKKHPDCIVSLKKLLKEMNVSYNFFQHIFNNYIQFFNKDFPIIDLCLKYNYPFNTIKFLVYDNFNITKETMQLSLENEDKRILKILANKY